MNNVSVNTWLIVKLVFAVLASVCLGMLIATYPDAGGHKDEAWGGVALLFTLCVFILP